MEKIRVGIIGAAGYTGGELIRLLLLHPKVSIAFARSDSQAGKAVSAIHRDLEGDTSLVFSGSNHEDIDVLFCCTGHGETKKFLEQNPIAKGVRIIDLSQDFRLGESLNGRKFVYGLPESDRENIKLANNIANPGCFATAIQLALLPLAKAGNLRNKEVHVSGITGSTGAGVGLNATSHFSWRANNLSTYKVFNHQHLKEINMNLRKHGAAEEMEIQFIPYRGPFTRGIWITTYLTLGDQDTVDYEKLYADYYQGHTFTHVSQGELDLKMVVNTNKCLVKVEKHGSKLLVYSIIDNLIKGASGQAIQNMNLMFGLDEKEGLNLKSTAF
jgi:N-acetyl-gamma-glutamyl-phosphate reductase